MTEPTRIDAGDQVGPGDQVGAGDTATFPAGAGGVHPAPEPQHAADRIRAVVLAVPGVADLHGGAFGEAATYLPGRRVPGVRLTEDGTAEVHVVLTLDVPVLATAARVRDAVAVVVGGRVDVVVEDVVEPARDPDHPPAESLEAL